MAVTRGPDQDTLRHQVEALEWYHTLELAPGLVTPGWFDTRKVTSQVPIPESLRGMRCLDIGTFDGFWAFEMERRGAAEVHAIDILDPRRWDWPAGASQDAIAAIGKRKAAGEGFEVARQALGSKVRRHELSIYDLDPEILGEFDLAYIGSLLIHLRDPVGALMRVRQVCRGKLVVVDNVDAVLSWAFRRRPIAGLDGVGRPWWWKANVSGVVRMLTAAGFELEQPPIRLYMPPGPGQQVTRPRLRALRSLAGIEAAITARRGDPHVALLARPAR